jgi:pimeloyl-ACP methyl ester carboxylesterase
MNMAIHPSRTTPGRHLRIPVGEIALSGNLVLPETASSLVIFSHGSGSSRFSVRNNFVAQQLQKRNIGTCLVDLLTAGEDAVYANRFNIDLLTERLIKITQWICGLSEVKGLPTGYFGASTGAASALKAAARLKPRIAAVVSRGGRPDLAHARLAEVQAATLLIVGERDADVLRLKSCAVSSTCR